MTPAEVRALIFELPRVEELPRSGMIPFKVRGMGLCGLGARTGPDDLQIGGLSQDEIEHLIEVDPETFHSPPHYFNARHILVRIGSVDPAQLRSLLERRWRNIVPKSWAKARDAGLPLPE